MHWCGKMIILLQKTCECGLGPSLMVTGVLCNDVLYLTLGIFHFFQFLPWYPKVNTKAVHFWFGFVLPSTVRFLCPTGSPTPSPLTTFLNLKALCSQVQSIEVLYLKSFPLVRRYHHSNASHCILVPLFFL